MDASKRYLINKIKTSKKRIEESTGVAQCKAHKDIADGLSCLLEVQEYNLSGKTDIDEEEKTESFFSYSKIGKILGVAILVIIFGIGIYNEIKIETHETVDSITAIVDPQNKTN